MIILYLILVSLIAHGLLGSDVNVFNKKLNVCSLNPLTGFTRTGHCNTNKYDYGTHLICATVTDEFLSYTKSQGNDLSTPRSYFPGLKSGDNWCLCVFRWLQAYKSGVYTSVVLSSTHKNSLDYLKRYNLSLNDLKRSNYNRRKNSSKSLKPRSTNIKDALTEKLTIDSTYKKSAS
jgi:uncharacterized protein (DUF2237 family)